MKTENFVLVVSLQLVKICLDATKGAEKCLALYFQKTNLEANDELRNIPKNFSLFCFVRTGGG